MGVETQYVALQDTFTCKNVSTNFFFVQRVKDLQYSDVCHMDSSDSEFTSELYLYVIIFVEAVLIILIIAKVWIDGKSYRQTGILPW